MTTRRLLPALAILVAVGLCALLVLAVAKPADEEGSTPVPDAGRLGTERDPTLAGTGASAQPNLYEQADLQTTLGAFRNQPPHVPAGAAARLSEFVASDSALLDHLVQVALKEEEIRPGLLPEDYPYQAFEAAGFALEVLGRPAATALAKRLAISTSPTHRRTILYTLQRLHESAAPAADVLIALFRDDASSVEERKRALESLTRIGAPARALVPDLLAILRDPDDPFFDHALRGLYPMAGMTPEVAKAYTDLFAHDDAYLVMDVLLNIQKIRAEDCEILRPHLEGLIGHEQPDVRCMALWALASIGVKDAGTAQRVGNMMEDEGEDEMRAAVAVLLASGEIGTAELLDVARRTDLLVVTLEACRALAVAEFPLADHPEILVPLFQEGEGPVLYGASDLLRDLSPGPSAEVFLPLLAREIRDAESVRRWSAVHVLPNVRGDDDAVIALFIEALADEDLWEPTVESMAGFHRQAARIVPVLLKELARGPYTVANTLGELARKHPPARMELQRIATTHESGVCRTAAHNALLMLDDPERDR